MPQMNYHYRFDVTDLLISKISNGDIWAVGHPIHFMFGSMVWFSGTANLMVSFKFTPDVPCCHGNEICDKIGYNSACIRDIS